MMRRLESVELMQLSSDSESICAYCRRDATSPRILSCCASVVCKKCRDKIYATETVCPFCRETLMSLSPPPLRGAKTVETSDSLCPTHRKIFEYFCEECSKFLCSVCIFDLATNNDKTHEGHSIQKIENLPDAIRSKVKTKVDNLTRTLGSMKERLSSSEEEKDALDTTKIELFDEMRLEFRDFGKNFGYAYSMAEKSIETLSMELQTLTEDINSIIEDSEYAMQHDTKNGPLIIDGVISKIRDVRARIPKEIPQEISLEWTNEIAPPFTRFRYEVPNFINCMHEMSCKDAGDSKYVFSPHQNIGGFQWRAKIFPNGNINGLGTHVSAYVELMSPTTVPLSFQYRIDIIHPDPEKKPITHSCNSEFEEKDSWGWARMAQIERIMSEGYIFPNGSLVFEYSVRPVGYFVLADSSTRELAALRERYKRLKEERVVD